MRIIGYLLFAVGIMVAIAAGAKLPAEQGQFPDTLPYFVAGVIASVAGVGLWRTDVWQKSAAQRKQPSADRRDAVHLIENLVEPIDRLAVDADGLDGVALTERTDQLLDDYVLPLAEVRHDLIDRYGMSAGAEILVTMSVAERMLNRVWSAAADGYLDEARNCLPEAVEAAHEAARLVRKATG